MAFPLGEIWTLDSRNLFLIVQKRKCRRWQLASRNRNASLIFHLLLSVQRVLRDILYLSVSCLELFDEAVLSF